MGLTVCIVVYRNGMYVLGPDRKGDDGFTPLLPHTLPNSQYISVRARQ